MNRNPGDAPRYDLSQAQYDAWVNTWEEAMTETDNGDYVLYCRYCHCNLDRAEMVKPLFWHRELHVVASPNCRGMVTIIKSWEIP